MAEHRAVGGGQLAGPRGGGGKRARWSLLAEPEAGSVQVAVLRDIVATHLEASISRDLSEPATPVRFRRQVRSLNKLIEIVEARDSDGAESHWRAHLEAAAKSMSRMVPMDRQVVDLFSPETRPRSE